MPSSPSNQMQAAQSAGFDMSCGLANKSLDGLQKLVELNLRTMKSAMTDTLEATRKALAAKDMGEVICLQANWFQLAVEKAQAYQRELFEIAASAQSELATVADAQFAEGKHKMQGAIDNAAKGAPVGPEAALAAWLSALTAGTTWFETMQQTARQAIEVAERNTNMASARTQQAAAQTTRAARH